MTSIEADLAEEMRNIALEAAKPADPSAKPKEHMRRAWEALGRPTWWRLRAAWYGEAGAWRGAAIEDFRRRDAVRRRKEAEAREHAAELGGIYTAIADRLAADNPDINRERICRLLDTARALGARHRPVDRVGE